MEDTKTYEFRFTLEEMRLIRYACETLSFADDVSRNTIVDDKRKRKLDEMACYFDERVSEALRDYAVEAASSLLSVDFDANEKTATER